jgi:MoxR-like ATPase
MCGASPRATALLAAASRAAAALEDRDYVVPDDVQRLAAHLLPHRVLPTSAAELEGRSARDIVRAIIAATPVPR